MRCCICLNVSMCKEQAQIIVFTGNGKGKTTSALGLAVTEAVNGNKAVVIQFLKGGGYTGELFAAAFLAPYFTIRQFGYGCPISGEIKDGHSKCTKCGLCFRENRNPVNGYALKALSYANEVLQAGQTDILVLDEVSHALKHQLIPENSITELLLAKPENMTIVLTGRNMPETLTGLADKVVICEAVKHPMSSGIDARRGIEY